MKALIPFDSTQASTDNLRVGCREVLEKTEQPTILVAIFEGLEADQPLEQELEESEHFSEALLELAIELAHQEGVGLVEGQIIRCYRHQETEALLELAQTWQAEVIYLPFDPDQNRAKPLRKPGSKFRRWLGSRDKSLPLALEVYPTIFTDFVKVRVDEGKLLKLVKCPLAMTDAHEVVMRLSCIHPGESSALTSSSTQINPIAPAATLSWPEYTAAYLRARSGKTLNNAGNFGQN